MGIDTVYAICLHKYFYTGCITQTLVLSVGITLYIVFSLERVSKKKWRKMKRRNSRSSYTEAVDDGGENGGSTVKKSSWNFDQSYCIRERSCPVICEDMIHSNSPVQYGIVHNNCSWGKYAEYCTCVLCFISFITI